MMKIALENALRELKLGKASRMGSAGRVGSRQGTVSELTVIAPLKKGGAEYQQAW
jgi:hypothetical protein